MAFVLFISLWKASQNQKNWLLDSTWLDIFEPILHLGKEFTIWPGLGLSMFGFYSGLFQIQVYLHTVWIGLGLSNTRRDPPELQP